MLKIGIIGINDGNGHPYSYSSIFNGFKPELLHLCPFEVIRKYLVNVHKNENIITNAKVTHIWTQNLELSKNIADFTNIPNIVNDLDSLLNKVDAVILARDDIENHFEISKNFIKKGIPVFIDKLITDDFSSLNELLQLKNKSKGKIMATSSSRFTPEIFKAKKKLKQMNEKYIHGVSRVNWLRYANHLLDGITYLYGTDFESIQNISNSSEIDIMHIVYMNKLECILTIQNDLALPISITVYTKEEQVEIPFTDSDFSSYFFGFFNMLNDFVNYVITENSTLKFEDSLKITSLIILGNLSKNQNNRKVYFSEINKLPINKFINN